MAPKIQHKRSAVAGKAPQPADLDYGEIGVNYEATDPALYIKDSANAIRKIGTQPDATESVKGIAEIATQLETDTGTDDARIVTPKKLAVYVSQNLWIDGGSANSNFGGAPTAVDGGKA